MLNVPDNTKAIHVFVEMDFPVAVYACNEWEETQIQYLESNVKSSGITTLSLCEWCQAHNVSYQILYPFEKRDILKNPKRYIAFFRLKSKLK